MFCMIGEGEKNLPFILLSLPTKIIHQRFVWSNTSYRYFAKTGAPRAPAVLKNIISKTLVYFNFIS